MSSQGTDRSSQDRGGAATRHRILDAAWDLIGDRGLDVPMREIAAQVGISRQALYLHFPSRAHLLRAMTLHHDATTHIADRFAAALDAPDAVDALAALIETWFGYVEEILPVARALAGAAVTDEEAAAAWWEANDRAMNPIRRAVERLDGDGLLDDTWGVDEATQYLWSLTHVQTWDDLVVHHGWSPQHFVARQIDVATRILTGSRDHTPETAWGDRD